MLSSITDDFKSCPSMAMLKFYYRNNIKTFDEDLIINTTCVSEIPFLHIFSRRGNQKVNYKLKNDKLKKLTITIGKFGLEKN